MRTTNKYPKYKDSGVEWLGEIPVGWEVKKLKYIGKIKSGEAIVNEELKDEGLYEVFGGNGLMGFSFKYNVLGEKIIIGRVGAYCGNIRYSNLKRWISDNALILTLNEDQNYHYQSIVLKAAKLNNLNTSNAQPLVTGFKILNFPLSFPPLPEQTAIANFLDDKTVKIDQAITQKQTLIELLKERKQILIQNAVTKGLDPTVKMKDSGVEWIGEIPEGWEVKRLKYFVKIQGGYAFNSSDFRDNGIQIIKIANTYMNKLSLDRQPTFVDVSFLKTHKDWVVSKNDILMSLTGTMGKKDYGFAILIDGDKKFLLNQRVAKINIIEELEEEYLLLILRSDIYLNQLYSLPSGTKQANLSNDNVINIKVPIPPKIVRNQISTYIDLESKKIEKAISLQQAQIEKLKEYKATLINSAVTGKIKVC